MPPTETIHHIPNLQTETPTHDRPAGPHPAWLVTDPDALTPDDTQPPQVHPSPTSASGPAAVSPAHTSENPAALVPDAAGLDVREVRRLMERGTSEKHLLAAVVRGVALGLDAKAMYQLALGAGHRPRQGTWRRLVKTARARVAASDPASPAGLALRLAVTRALVARVLDPQLTTTQRSTLLGLAPLILESAARGLDTTLVSGETVGTILNRGRAAASTRVSDLLDVALTQAPNGRGGVRRVRVKRPLEAPLVEVADRHRATTQALLAETSEPLADALRLPAHAAWHYGPATPTTLVAWVAELAGETLLPQRAQRAQVAALRELVGADLHDTAAVERALDRVADHGSAVARAQAAAERNAAVAAQRAEFAALRKHSGRIRGQLRAAVGNPDGPAWVDRVAELLTASPPPADAMPAVRDAVIQMLRDAGSTRVEARTLVDERIPRTDEEGTTNTTKESA